MILWKVCLITSKLMPNSHAKSITFYFQVFGTLGAGLAPLSFLTVWQLTSSLPASVIAAIAIMAGEMFSKIILLKMNSLFFKLYHSKYWLQCMLHIYFYLVKVLRLFWIKFIFWQYFDQIKSYGLRFYLVEILSKYKFNPKESPNFP